MNKVGGFLSDSKFDFITGVFLGGTLDLEGPFGLKGIYHLTH